MIRYLLAALILTTTPAIADAKPHSRHHESRRPYHIRQRLLDAIIAHESGGNDHCKDGDNGKAIGPAQIHEAYFRDAAAYDRSLGDDYSRCRDREFAERVVRAYMARYCTEGMTDREICMIHNGGCSIHSRCGTEAHRNAEKYWEKVRKHLDK
jgi:hypothetical protein